jgi:hypothetical protein
MALWQQASMQPAEALVIHGAEQNSSLYRLNRERPGPQTLQHVALALACARGSGRFLRTAAPDKSEEKLGLAPVATPVLPLFYSAIYWLDLLLRPVAPVATPVLLLQMFHLFSF